MAEPVVATYSIAACDLEAGQWGVATQSKFLAVGSVVPWAEPDVGAIATQAYANPRYGPDGLALLREGASADEAVEQLTAADDGRDQRQLGVVDAQGGSATYTGAGCMRLGGRRRPAPASPRRGTFSSARRPSPRSRRPSPATQGKPLARAAARVPRRRAGRRRRPPRPAVGSAPRRRAGRRICRAQRRARRPAGRRPQACRSTELTRLYGLHDLLFGKTQRESWIVVDDELRSELTERLAQLGYAGPTRGFAPRRGRAPRTSRSGSTARERSTPSCCGSCARGERRRLRDPLDRRPRAAAVDRRHAGPAAAPPAPRLPAVRRRTPGSARTSGDHVIERAPRAETGPRSSTSCCAARAVHARRRAFDAPVGTLVHAPPGTLREATAVEPDTIVLAVGAKAGEAFTPSPWEDFYVAYAQLRAGDADAGRAAMQEALARDPDAWQGAYNAACFEALAGDARRGLRAPARAQSSERRRGRAVRARRQRPRLRSATTRATRELIVVTWRTSTSSTRSRCRTASSGGRSVGTSASARSASTRTRPMRSAGRSSKSIPRAASGTRRSTSCCAVAPAFTVDGNDHELGPGQLVFVRDPSLRRGAVALDSDTVVLALGGKPGEPHSRLGLGGDVRRRPRRRRAATGTRRSAIHEEALAEQPEHPALLYNLACMESRPAATSTRSSIWSERSSSSRNGPRTPAPTPTSTRSAPSRASRPSTHRPGAGRRRQAPAARAPDRPAAARRSAPPRSRRRA